MNIRSFPDTRGWSMVSSTNWFTAFRASGLFHRSATFAHGELELANGLCLKTNRVSIPTIIPTDRASKLPSHGLVYGTPLLL
jgi:hypothetical protein